MGGRNAKMDRTELRARTAFLTAILAEAEEAQDEHTPALSKGTEACAKISHSSTFCHGLTLCAQCTVALVWPHHRVYARPRQR